MGVELKARNLAQVSMNLTDFETTSLAKVFEAVNLEAAALGIQVVGSEIVGLVPRQALDDAAVHFLRIENFRPGIDGGESPGAGTGGAETRNSKRETRPSAHRPRQSAIVHTASARCGRWSRTFVNAVAAPTPTPGGGSVAALAGALAAGLGEMVCGVSLKRKSLGAHHPALEAARTRLAALRERLMEIDRSRPAKL